MSEENYFRLLKTQVREMLEKKGDDYIYWLLHLEEVAILCRLIAVKRNLDEDICQCAGLLHDIWLAFQTFPLEGNLHGKHGHYGSEVAKEILEKNGGLSDEKIKIICEMIYNHNDKEILHDEYSEALKDADVLQHYLNEDKWHRYSERGRKTASEL